MRRRGRRRRRLQHRRTAFDGRAIEWSEFGREGGGLDRSEKRAMMARRLLLQKNHRRAPSNKRLGREKTGVRANDRAINRRREENTRATLVETVYFFTTAAAASGRRVVPNVRPV